MSAVSWQAEQKLSAAPDWARGLPKAWPSAERLMSLDPGLIVFGPGEGGRAKAWAARFGVPAFELAWGEEFGVVRENLLLLGDALGVPSRAVAAVADLDGRLERLETRAAARGRAPSVFYLTPSGGSAGAGVFVDAAIRAAGGRNFLADQGAHGWARASAETVLTAEPDLIIISYFGEMFVSADMVATKGQHYRWLMDRAPRLAISGADWPCAGPRLIEAAEVIADALDRLP